MYCEKCGKEIKPRAFYFATEEEIEKELIHKCKPQ